MNEILQKRTTHSQHFDTGLKTVGGETIYQTRTSIAAMFKADLVTPVDIQQYRMDGDDVVFDGVFGIDELRFKAGTATYVKTINGTPTTHQGPTATLTGVTEDPRTGNKIVGYTTDNGPIRFTVKHTHIKHSEGVRLEVIEGRTEKSKRYSLGSNEYAEEISLGDIHFENDEGKLEDIVYGSNDKIAGNCEFILDEDELGYVIWRPNTTGPHKDDPEWSDAPDGDYWKHVRTAPCDVTFATGRIDIQEEVRRVNENAPSAQYNVTCSENLTVRQDGDTGYLEWANGDNAVIFTKYTPRCWSEATGSTEKDVLGTMEIDEDGNIEITWGDRSGLEYPIIEDPATTFGPTTENRRMQGDQPPFTWQTSHDAAISTSISDPGAATNRAMLGCNLVSDGGIYRGFMHFNTASIFTVFTVTGWNLSCYINSVDGTTTGSWMIAKGSFADVIVSGSWNDWTAANVGTAVAMSSISAGTRKTNVGTDMTAIVKGGVTRLVMLHSADLQNDLASAVNNGVSIDWSAGANPPVLTVAYVGYATSPGAGDGTMHYSTDVPWSTAWGASDSIGVNTNDGQVVAVKHGTDAYMIYRNRSPFPLQGISGATVLSGTFSFRPQYVENHEGAAFSLHLCEDTQTSLTALVTSDYSKLNAVSGGSIAVDGLTTGQYYDITLNATALTWCTPGSSAKIGVRASFDITNTPPTVTTPGGYNDVDIGNSEAANPQILTLTYTNAATDNASLRALGLSFALDFRETSGNVTDWVASQVGTVTGASSYAQTGPGLNKSIKGNGSTFKIVFADNAVHHFSTGSFFLEIWASSTAAANKMAMQIGSAVAARSQIGMPISGAGGFNVQAAVNDGVNSAVPAQDTFQDNDGVQRQFIFVVDHGLNQKAIIYRNVVPVNSADCSAVGSPDSGFGMVIGARVLLQDLNSDGYISLVRIFKGSLPTAGALEALNNGNFGLALRTPVATSITPSIGAKGQTVTVTSVLGDHYSGNGKTSFLLRKSAQSDILSSSFTPSSLTDGAGQITIPGGAASGGWNLVTVVNGEESNVVTNAFTVTGSSSALSLITLMSQS